MPQSQLIIWFHVLHQSNFLMIFAKQISEFFYYHEIYGLFRRVYTIMLIALVALFICSIRPQTKSLWIVSIELISKLLFIVDSNLIHLCVAMKRVKHINPILPYCLGAYEWKRQRRIVDKTPDSVVDIKLLKYFGSLFSVPINQLKAVRVFCIQSLKQIITHLLFIWCKSKRKINQIAFHFVLFELYFILRYKLRMENAKKEHTVTNRQSNHAYQTPCTIFQWNCIWFRYIFKCLRRWNSV